MVLEPRSSNYPTCVPAFESPCSHHAKPRTDFPAFEKLTPLSEAHPAYPGWGRLLPYLHQVHDHEPQEVPVMRQLPEVLAQGDAARLLSTQAMGQRGVKNSLGLGQIHPHPGQPPIRRGISSEIRLRTVLATHPLSAARSGHPGSLPAASTRRLRSRVAPTKPSAEPAASATQKARKEEKSSLFQKA